MAKIGDRRRRHENNPTIPMTIGLPQDLKDQLDDAAAERNMTRNGFLAMVLRYWFEHHPRREKSKS